jgi:hypothetical protein
MRNLLIIGLLMLVVGLGLGYWFGNKTYKQLTKQGKQQIFTQIELKDGRTLNNSFKESIQKGQFILDSKQMWESMYVEGKTISYILSQEECNGLRVYPGIDEKNNFTLIFIGSKGNDDDNIYLKKGPKLEDDIAVVQDNNDPCKPICRHKL